MKKLLLSAIAVLGAMTYAQADEIVLDFTTNAYGQTVAGSANDKYYMEDGSSFSDGPITITANKLDGSGVRFWATDAGAQTFRVNNKSGITISISGGTITEFKFTGSNYKYLQGEGYNDGSWTGSASEIALVNKGDGTNTGTVQLKTLTITYTGGVEDTRLAAGLAFPEEKYTVALGSEFTAPALTKETTAVVTYSSDKETVATVDPATGAVTLVGVGTARITAKAEANDDYKAGSASYLLTVNPAPVVGAIFTSLLGEGFSFDNPEGLNVWQQTASYGLKASAFINNTTNASVAIAYTTDFIDLTKRTSATLTYEQAFNQYKLNNVMIDVDGLSEYAKVVVREAETTNWVEIAEPTAPEAFSWNFYGETIDLTPYCGKLIQFGYKYISTAELAGTWEIKNINVVATGGEDSIEAIQAAPAADAIFDLQGRRVIAPAHGLYIRGGKVVRL